MYEKGGMRMPLSAPVNIGSNAYVLKEGER